MMVSVYVVRGMVVSVPVIRVTVPVAVAVMRVTVCVAVTVVRDTVSGMQTEMTRLKCEV